MLPRSSIRRLLRFVRDQQQAWARLRHERFRDGAESARDQERAVLGALLLDPTLIRPVAARCPPAWFTDVRCVTIMQALFCCSHVSLEVTLADVVRALESHGQLAFVGGEDEVAGLVQPGPRLDAARAALEDARRRLGPISVDPIVSFARTLLAAEPADPCPGAPAL